MLDVPTYPEPLFITDAAINIFPDLEAKCDIVQNVIDLFTQVGLGTPRGCNSVRRRDCDTLKSRRPSTPPRSAKWPSAARSQRTASLWHRF